MKRFDLKYGIYALAIVLLIILFGFGSYMNDMKVDVLRTSQAAPINQKVIGGIVPNSPDRQSDIIDYFEKIKQIEKPETFVILAQTDVSSESTPLVVQNGRLDYDNKFIDTITEAKYVSVNNDLFDDHDEICSLVDRIKYSFPDARIVSVFFTKEAGSIDAYRFSRLLKGAVADSSRKVFVLGLTEFSNVKDPYLKELQDVTTERAFYNFDISALKKLKISSPLAIKSALYYFHFSQAKRPYMNDLYTFYTKEDAPEKMERVTILGFGDVMLGRAVRSLMDKHGLNYPFEKIAADIGGTDYVFANFEGPIKEFPVVTSKSISFRFKPDVVRVIKDAGITIVSIANNHALDQGWGGRDDTKKFLDAGGVSYFGHPKNTHEENVHISEISGSKVAFLGYDDTIFKIDADSAASYIRQLKAENDYVIISIHWGIEYKHTPTSRKVELAHTFVDAGADLIIGHHPHVVQTMEIYKDVPVFYSLGNFVFDQYFSQDTQEGLAIGAVLEKERTVIYLYPYAIPNSRPILMNVQEKAAFFDKFVAWGNYNEALTNAIKSGKIIIEKSQPRL